MVDYFIMKDGWAHAIAKSNLHHHDGEPETWIDVIFGSFSEEASKDSRLTFGCRLGQFGEAGTPAASLVDAAAPYGDSPVWGHKLSREEALTHELLPELWDLIDWLMLEEPIIHHHMYGHAIEN